MYYAAAVAVLAIAIFFFLKSRADKGTRISNAERKELEKARFEKDMGV